MANSLNSSKPALIGGSIVVATLVGALTLNFVTDRAKIRPSCPEQVKKDRRGDPRNAAGQIRYCWPGMAKCHCDQDNDCYAEPGYVACAPVTNGGVDAGVRDAGPVDTGPRDTGSPRDTGVPDTGSRDSGPRDTGPSDLGSDIRDVGSSQAPSARIPSFTGAEGFGSTASGGRGGRVIYVTNLNTSGPGSLQDAVSQTGPRYVLFKVSGVINGDVQILHGDVTIAGQSSPGGITVRGIHTTENPYCDQQCGANAKGVENFVIRFLRSRPASGDFPDGLRLRYARNGVIDHVSIGNAQDEAVEISYSNNITIQNVILAETIGSHAQYGGMLINYTNPAAGYALDNLSIHHNVWNRIQGRYPEFSRESAGVAAGTTLHADLVNNLIWDQRYYIDVNPTDISGSNDGRDIFYAINWVGNLGWAKSGYRYGMIWLQGGDGNAAFFNDNRMNLWRATDWDLNYCCNDYNGNYGTRPSWSRTSRLEFPRVTTIASASLREYAVATAGCFPRDPMDRRLMGFVAAGTFDSHAINVNPAGDALRVAYSGSPPAAPADTDDDGMPDEWEVVHGLNPTIQDHNGRYMDEGYTNLEVYLDDLARALISP